MTLLQRKLSTLTFSGLSQSSSTTSSQNARSPTLQSSRSNAPTNKRRQSGLRYIFSHPRKHLAQSELMTPPSSPLTTQPSLVISKLAKAFADSLNTTELSNFLVWMLYFDTVELPGTPELWYKCVDNTDMQGWVALGKLLANSRESAVEYGFDLIVMASICDRISLSRGTVHDLLIRFADPEQMKYAAIASTITKAEENGWSKIEALEAVQAKLHELNRLATNLHPQPGPSYEEQLTMIRKRLRGLLHLVIGPRIANLKAGETTRHRRGIRPCTKGYSGRYQTQLPIRSDATRARGTIAQIW